MQQVEHGFVKQGWCTGEFLGPRFAVFFGQDAEVLLDATFGDRGAGGAAGRREFRDEPAEQQERSPGNGAGPGELSIGQVLLGSMRATPSARISACRPVKSSRMRCAALAAAQPVTFLLGQVIDVNDRRLHEEAPYLVPRACFPGSAAFSMRSAGVADWLTGPLTRCLASSRSMVSSASASSSPA